MSNETTAFRSVLAGRGSLAQQVKLDRESRIPLHAQLRHELARVIENDFGDGDQFFAERELVEALTVSRITVRRALDDLSEQGYLVRKVGRGGTTVRLAPTNSVKWDGNRPPPRVQPTMIGIFVPDWRSESIDAILRELASASRRNGMEIALHWLHQDETIDSILAQCRERSEETAFVLNLGSDTNGLLFQALHQRGHKTVSTDPMVEGYGGDVVSTDPRAAVRIGLEHLFSLGHERIVLLVNEPIRDKSVVDKIEEFLKQMSERGLSLVGRTVICGTQAWHSSYEAAYGHMEEVWDHWAGPKPTAIFTVSDPGAWAVLKWFRERGIDIPGDVSVIGFENAGSSAYVTPALTTLAHPIADIAARAIEALLAPHSEQGRVQLIPPILIVRESSGPAKLLK